MDPIDYSLEPNPQQIARVTQWLALGGYRVIGPLPLRTAFSDAQPPEKLITVAILDTETTGTNPACDRIIELGMVLVELCPETGQAFRILRVFNDCLLYTSPSPRDGLLSRMPSSA